MYMILSLYHNIVPVFIELSAQLEVAVVGNIIAITIRVSVPFGRYIICVG